MTNINSYTDEFKKQIVALYQSGKSVSCLAKEYNVTRAATYEWIKQFTNSGSFKIKNNLSDLEKQLTDFSPHVLVEGIMKLNEFNNAFQTEQQCLAYIANLKENKCIRCFSFNLNTSD
ncbi:transposase [Spiroplasma ixodetis]|uniref:Transposase n=1 Tax=Spiroplasma ixodetis TaxID=2141 RepID=A0ABM8BYS6_9MOLU|nr:transposase [Spiroplasma ixodetis]BDT04872.1 hypothetical protein SHM_25180 [Spiroplasma ixodetis]